MRVYENINLILKTLEKITLDFQSLYYYKHLIIIGLYYIFAEIIFLNKKII